MARQPVIAGGLDNVLSRLREKIIRRERLTPELDQVLDALGALSPYLVSRVEAELAHHLGWWWFGGPPVPGMIWNKLWPMRGQEVELLSSFRLEYLFLFHKNGRIREAALRKIVGGLPNAFFVAAIALRLNDWAAPVREAARDCARIVFPKTDAAVVADAAFFLIDRTRSWQRWTNSDLILDTTLARADVVKLLANRFLKETTGPLGALLRFAALREGLDEFFYELYHCAKSAAVRATAFQILVEGRVKVVQGFEREWINKPYNIYRLVPVFAERPIRQTITVRELIEEGIHDRLPLIRRLAGDALILHRCEFDDLLKLAAVLANDPSRSVRERGQFLLRSLQPGGSGPGG